MKGPLRRNPFRRRSSDPVPQESQPTTVMPPETAAPAPETLPAGVALEDVSAARPSFRDRGRLRRRMRYLRRVRELGFRDLGGLVFDLHRFARRNDELVLGKLAALDAVDRELRAIERVLDERRDIIELREPGVAACPRCGALHGSDARFCPQCGTQFSGPLAIGEVGGPAPAPATPGASSAADQAPTETRGTPVSGALPGQAPQPATQAPEPPAVNPPPATEPAEPPAVNPPPGPASKQAAPTSEDQPTQAMPAVTNGDPLAPRERPGS